MVNAEDIAIMDAVSPVGKWFSSSFSLEMMNDLRTLLPLLTLSATLVCLLKERPKLSRTRLNAQRKSETAKNSSVSKDKIN